jgi:hypothetical protein
LALRDAFFARALMKNQEEASQEVTAVTDGIDSFYPGVA